MSGKDKYDMAIIANISGRELGDIESNNPILLAYGIDIFSNRQVYGAFEALIAWGLGNLGDRAPLPPLLAGIMDERYDVQVAAIEALGKLGDRTPIEPLITALNDKSSEVREAAAWALGQLGERTPIEVL